MINQKTILNKKGSKKISKEKKIIIMELTNQYRMWTLNTEI
uniref:Cytochrome b6-f complex subunit PetP n=1 Tax=Polysiphonia elongata TaxID=159753 RepID=A0A1Z1MB89_9FLOR|nr:cytochrome b6-f complex subunit PetP [Polysiphonia elongata]ARW63347.1 cytochrome b6-f complex subunit PetP [Polysiphonia elongata]